jgi:hypothetical protein
MIWYDMIWYDMIWYDMIWYDMIFWFDLIWFDLIWFDLIWFDLIWNTCIMRNMPHGILHVFNPILYEYEFQNPQMGCPACIGYLGRFFETARTAWWSTPKKHSSKKILKKKLLIKNHKCIKSSSKIYNFYFFGGLGQAVHQAVSKKRPKSPKLDIPF